MVKPRLIHKMRVEIAKLPLAVEARDDVWRTLERDTDDILEDPNVPKVIINAQVKFGMFEEIEQMATGSDESTDGYLIIEEKDQDLHQFKPNDHVVRILGRGKKPRCVQLRIIQVKPVAQRVTFGLYRLDFKDDSRGQA